METYGKILLFAMPAFLFLVLFEKAYGWYRKQDTVRNMDMISSLSSGVTNVTKDVLGLSIAILSYSWLVGKVQLIQIKTTWLTYIIAFLVIDFAGYWVHRWSHKINVLWNLHIIHHSSEEFNLACALRQSITLIINPFTILLLPAALLGVPTEVIATVGPIQLFAQFWYHTQHIGKMGIFEHIIVTPSHHRVHHAINREYIDKNLSQIFIVWDKLFGTFQPELVEVPPVYGITRPVSTWNPIRINFSHFWLMIQDAWRTRSWKEKFTLWFKPTGYRPSDVTNRYPVYKIEDVYDFRKYGTRTSKALNIWCWLQILMILLFIAYLFGNIALINQLDQRYIYIYGGFVFLSVYALTELMDRNPSAAFWELGRDGLGIFFLFQQDDWFGASAQYPWIKYALLGYFSVSLLITVYFVLRHRKEDKMYITEVGKGVPRVWS